MDFFQTHPKLVLKDLNTFTFLLIDFFISIDILVTLFTVISLKNKNKIILIYFYPDFYQNFFFSLLTRLVCPLLT